MTASKKDRTVAIQNSLETGQRFPLSYFDSRRYVQHNLAIGDGLGSLLEFIDQLPPGSTRVHAIRAFEDGGISFAHLEYMLAPLGRVVGFEVHRWDDDRIVEHWDNLQPLIDSPNASGRTMTDGPTDITDHDCTQSNKDIVERYLHVVAVDRDLSRLGEFFHCDQLVEHNPESRDGVEALRARLAERQLGLGTNRQRVHRILGEGNFVLAMSEVTIAAGHFAEYDLFRLHCDKIVEHWDVVEAIPPRSEWKNDNGKF